jgi:amidophosphoribosyltransferase
VKLKHSANRSVLAGRRVILVDDSIVRGTTSRKIVEMVRQAGAREVHMRISSPPTTHSCFYGIDTPERGELLAARLSVEEMAEQIAWTARHHLDRRAVSRGARDRIRRGRTYCDACLPATIRLRCRTRRHLSANRAPLAESH